LDLGCLYTEEQMSTVTVTGPIQSASAQNFEQIYREHATLVFRTAYGVTGSREDAEDILQNVFARLMSRGLPRDFEKNPKGYLYRAAVNRSLNVIEARRRRPQLVDAAHVPELAPSPEDPCFKQEMHQRLYEAISKLSPRAAEILTLRYVHDASDAEIAKMLGLSRTTVAVRLFRLRARLRKLLRRSLGEKA
jgi:RNA polymerase sigma-70 factor (ECF subfamily)